MPKDRFYVDSALQAGEQVTLTDAEARHLVQVMRGRIGTHVELVNGRGDLADAELIRTDRHSCELEILQAERQLPDPLRLIIAQAIPRHTRLDTIIEKGTELGMSALWLFPGEKSERDTLSEQQQARVHTVAVAAMKQCGRLYLPEILLKPSLSEWSPPTLNSYFGDLRLDAPLFAAEWRRIPPQGEALFFVGPEAGFSENEVKQLKHLGAKGVRLHKNILRTDTAPLVALSLMHHWHMG